MSKIIKRGRGARLTPAEKAKIQELYADGKTFTAITQITGVGYPTIKKLVSDESQEDRGVTTHKALIAAVTKSLFPSLKKAQALENAASNAIEISVSIKVGKTSYSTVELLVEAANAAEEKIAKEAKIKALEAEIARLRA